MALKKNKKYDPPSYGKSPAGAKKASLSPFSKYFKSNQPAFKGDNTKMYRRDK